MTANVNWQNVPSDPKHNTKFGKGAGTPEQVQAERDRLSRLDLNSRNDLYRERAKGLAASKYALDRLAVDILGPELIASIALALDPYTRFKLTTNPVVKANRFRKLPGIIGQSRSYTYTTPNSTVAYQTVHGVSSPDFSSYDDSPKGSAVLTPQENIDGFLNDTSFASRKGASKYGRRDYSYQGEMELYVPNLRTTPWSYNWRERDNVSITDAEPISTYYGRSIKDHHTVVKGPTQRISRSTHDVWASAYRANAASTLSKQGPALVAKCLPTSRLFNLTYNIAELRELPRLLRDAVARLRSMEKVLHDIQNTGSLYLEYKFAWESTVRAVLQLLKIPEQISKRINYLLKRNGKLTTLHFKRSWSEPLSSSPSFAYEIYPYDVVLDSASVRGVHNVELRCAINSRIELPHVDVPKLREILYQELLGADIRPSDIYNLVPWTWLIDWFGGLGDYVSCLETLYNDPSLINYGFLSYVSTGEIKSELKLKADGSKATAITGNPTVTETVKYRPNRDASFFFKYHLRRSVASLDGVKIVSDLSSLSGSQKAIVTALLTKGGGRPAGNVTGNSSS